MNDAAVGFQCPDCVREAAKGSRQHRALYGGRRSGDPRLTSYVLIGINALVWLAIVATGGGGSRLTDLLALTPRGLCRIPGDGYYAFPDSLCAVNGGAFSPGVSDGAWWQLLTSAFTHVQVWHVALNLLALAVLGPATEQILGRARFLAVYLVAALGGSVVVMWFSDEFVSTLGASGAIYGLLGALLVTFTKARRDTQWIAQNVMLGVVISVVGWRYISWQGHLGGFLAGAAAAAIVAYAPKRHRTLVQWVGLAVLTAVLLAAAVVRAVALA
jgi:membrane associated rhomboid family serine protease